MADEAGGRDLAAWLVINDVITMATSVATQHLDFLICERLTQRRDVLKAENMVVLSWFFNARRLAKRGICRRRVTVCPSVCLSVCVCVCVCVCVRHTPVLYQNG